MSEKIHVEKENKKRSKLGLVLWGVAIFVMLLLSFSAKWALQTWVDLTVDELIYHLKSPMEGVGDGLIGKFVLSCLLPALVIAVLGVIGIAMQERKGDTTLGLKIVGLASAALVLAFFAYGFWTGLDFTQYIENQTADTAFIEQQYVDPLEVGIEFPSKKRNLVLELHKSKTDAKQLPANDREPFTDFPYLNLIFLSMVFKFTSTL